MLLYFAFICLPDVIIRIVSIATWLHDLIIKAILHMWLPKVTCCRILYDKSKSLYILKI